MAWKCCRHFYQNALIFFRAKTRAFWSKRWQGFQPLATFSAHFLADIEEPSTVQILLFYIFLYIHLSSLSTFPHINTLTVQYIRTYNICMYSTVRYLILYILHTYIHIMYTSPVSVTSHESTYHLSLLLSPHAITSCLSPHLPLPPP